MGFTKDLHTRKGPDGKRVRTAKWGKGKRWLAVWHDEYGRERSCTFTMKDAADAYWQSMETDRVRGEYTDPKAGRELFGEIGRRWLDSRAVDPASKIHYERAGRLRVEPAFGRRQVGKIKPGAVQAWLATLTETYAESTVSTAYLVL